MSTVSSSGATIAYDVHGDPGAPALLFLNSIGSTRALWDRQRRALGHAYRVIQYDARMALVRERGMAAVADVAIPNWFTERFRAREPETVRRFRDDIESTPLKGYLGCSAAMREEDLRDSLPSVRCPVLAIAGAVDRSTPPELLQFIHQRLPGSQLVTLDAAHISNVEQDAAFSAALSTFLAAHA